MPILTKRLVLPVAVVLAAAARSAPGAYFCDICRGNCQDYASREFTLCQQSFENCVATCGNRADCIAGCEQRRTQCFDAAEQRREVCFNTCC